MHPQCAFYNIWQQTSYLHQPKNLDDPQGVQLHTHRLLIMQNTWMHSAHLAVWALHHDIQQSLSRGNRDQSKGQIILDIKGHTPTQIHTLGGLANAKCACDSCTRCQRWDISLCWYLAKYSSFFFPPLAWSGSLICYIHFINWIGFKVNPLSVYVLLFILKELSPSESAGSTLIVLTIKNITMLKLHRC